MGSELHTDPPVTFQVYYRDGSTYSGDPFLTPTLEAVLVVEKDAEHGRRYVSGFDYLVWEDGRWYGVDQIGMFQYMVRLGPRRVLFGVMMPNEDWNKLVWRARQNTLFPEKTASGPFEQIK